MLSDEGYAVVLHHGWEHIGAREAIVAGEHAHVQVYLHVLVLLVELAVQVAVYLIRTLHFLSCQRVFIIDVGLVAEQRREECHDV